MSFPSRRTVKGQREILTFPRERSQERLGDRVALLVNPLSRAVPHLEFSF